MNQQQQQEEDGGRLPQELQAPRLQLQDLEHYLQRNGIEAQQEGDQPYQRLDQVELAAVVSKEEKYQRRIIQKFMEEDNERLLQNEKEQMSQKKLILDQIRDKHISIQTANEVLTNVSLYPLADQCDTIYTLISSNHWSKEVSVASNTNESKSESESEWTLKLLEPYPSKSVSKFLSILHQSSTVQDLGNDTIIECCQIAHLLQCQHILDEIVEIIRTSIDSENCTSICILADDLNIPSLLHSSMGFIMNRLEDIQSDDELWEDIPSSLKAHIITLRNAASSSIIGRGCYGGTTGTGTGEGKSSRRVLFSSSDEFLAIFSDTLRDHKDRLREAKERQREIIEERERRNRDHPFFSRRDVYGGSVKDADVKIEKQEKRVQTLEAFYKEQKAIFAQNLNSKFQGSFSL